jgi:hypothetical protein
VLVECGGHKREYESQKRKLIEASKCLWSSKMLVKCRYSSYKSSEMYSVEVLERTDRHRGDTV